jgi:hypothetical protein
LRVITVKGVSMKYLMIRHNVQDYDEWKTVYDAQEKMRIDYGIKEKYVLHKIDSPNELTILFEVDDVEKAKEFMHSPDLKEAMQKAGVLTKPDIFFLKG